ncbi:MATE family efflux transporter [Plebeiibacterium sediminum]|uniref:MATE family efflux transporter n=1 Tax=Plebeiibacterium sediminum TaxID=2992112 RepID=A0AAE3M364_9BACT|nr:MATE family efflux transporter [Plebeiobacterium sediminum]MCW3786248.1 MATE family efflux transporter [Plebeiobacterium sediminum]
MSNWVRKFKTCKLVSSIYEGHERSVIAKKNIVASFGIKGLSIINGFLLVTVTLNYLDQTRYGIWLTISSLFVWISFMDVGLGKGLRNKLTEAISNKDFILARKYISTSYAILGIIIGLMWGVYILVHPFLDWYAILNTEEEIVDNLSSITLIVFSSFFIQFFLQLFTNVLYAFQRSAIAISYGPVSNFIVLIIIYILSRFGSGTLLNLALVQSFVPLLILLISSIYFFRNDYKSISPQLNYIEFKYIKEILSLGINFFLISIGRIIRYQSANILISQLFGPAQVTPYSIAFKYFGVLNMVFSVMLTPMWSAFTEAYALNDISWIKSSIRKLNKWIFYVSFFGLFLLIISNYIYKIWVGDSIRITIGLSSLMLVYNITLSYGGIYSSLANGIGKVKLQMILSIIGSIIYIPMVLFFVKYLHWGIESIILCTILTNWYGPFIGPFHLKKVIDKKIKEIAANG